MKNIKRLTIELFAGSISNKEKDFKLSENDSLAKISYSIKLI